MEISQLQNSIHPLYGTHQMLQEPRFHWLGERCLFCVIITQKSSKLVSLCHLELWPERRYQLWRKSNDKSTILRMQSNATGSRSMIKSLILPYFIFPSIKNNESSFRLFSNSISVAESNKEYHIFNISPIFGRILHSSSHRFHDRPLQDGQFWSVLHIYDQLGNYDVYDYERVRCNSSTNMALSTRICR